MIVKMFLRRNPVPFKIMYKNVILKSLFICNNFQVLYQTNQNRYDDDILKISYILYIDYIKRFSYYNLLFVFNSILSYIF